MTAKDNRRILSGCCYRKLIKTAHKFACLQLIWEPLYPYAIVEVKGSHGFFWESFHFFVGPLIRMQFAPAHSRSVTLHQHLSLLRSLRCKEPSRRCFSDCRIVELFSFGVCTAASVCPFMSVSRRAGVARVHELQAPP
jgi:hypothetical protein